MPATKRYPAWPADELALLRREFELGATAPMIQRLMPHRSLGAVKNQIQALQAQGMERKQRLVAHQGGAAPLIVPSALSVAPSGDVVAQTFGAVEAQDEPDDVFMARMLQDNQRVIGKADTQRYARIRIVADGPVALSLSSDWHVGQGADLQGLIRYVDWMAHTPNVYGLVVGDLFDNPIKHKGGSVAQVKDELRLLDLLIGRAQGRILGMTSGNHDDWSKTLAGVDNLRALALKHRLHYAPDELLWDVELVSSADPETVTATYRIYTRHQWRRGSTLNPGHACWTWWQEEGPNWTHRPDVLAIGHNHVAVVEQRSFADQAPVWAVRMGAWQVDSAFARAKGFGRYRATAPTCVLWPYRARDVACFADYRDAELYMAGAGA